MCRAYEEIGQRGRYADSVQTKLRISNLRQDLLVNGVVAPSTGKPYGKGRGIFAALSAAWRYFTRKGDHVTAQNIADWITDDYGNLVHLNY